VCEVLAGYWYGSTATLGATGEFPVQSRFLMAIDVILSACLAIVALYFSSPQHPSTWDQLILIC